MSNENSKLLSTLASIVDSSTTSQSLSSCLTNTGEKVSTLSLAEPQNNSHRAVKKIYLFCLRSLKTFSL